MSVTLAPTVARVAAANLPTTTLLAILGYFLLSNMGQLDERLDAALAGMESQSEEVDALEIESALTGQRVAAVERRCCS